MTHEQEQRALEKAAATIADDKGERGLVEEQAVLHGMARLHKPRLRVVEAAKKWRAIPTPLDEHDREGAELCYAVDALEALEKEADGG